MPTPEEIRLECLKLAVERFKGCSITQLHECHLDVARKFEDYVVAGADNQKGPKTQAGAKPTPKTG